MHPSDRILKAGRRLFFAHGFESVSTDALAREAGVSKATLYKYFPNMRVVLKAVTEAEADSFQADVLRDVNSPNELRDALTRYGANLLVFLNQPDVLQFSAVMFEEARRHPEAAEMFYTAAYGRVLSMVADLFERARVKGIYVSAVPSPELAELLVGMWEGLPMVRAHLKLTRRPFPRPNDWAGKAVSLLFDGLLAR